MSKKFIEQRYSILHNVLIVTPKATNINPWPAMRFWNNYHAYITCTSIFKIGFQLSVYWTFILAIYMYMYMYMYHGNVLKLYLPVDVSGINEKQYLHVGPSHSRTATLLGAFAKIFLYFSPLFMLLYFVCEIVA